MDSLIKRFFAILRRSANNRSASQQGSGLDFGLCSWMRLLLGTLLTVLVLFGLVVWMALKPEGGPHFVLLIPFGLLLAICFATPSPVGTNEDGVRQGRWFRRKIIPWNEVVEAVRNPDNGCTEVRGKWGAVISFSPTSWLRIVLSERYSFTPKSRRFPLAFSGQARALSQRSDRVAIGACEVDGIQEKNTFIIS